jgi:hypothetical protein
MQRQNAAKASSPCVLINRNNKQEEKHTTYRRELANNDISRRDKT